MENKDRITLKCSDCGASFDLQCGWVKKFPNDHTWRCPKCRVEHHKNWLKNMPDDKRKEVSAKMSKSAKQRWANMSSEEYDSICQKMSEGSRYYWDNLSDKQYAMRCEAAQRMWDSLSPEQRLQHSTNISKMQVERWKNMSSDEYLRMKRMLSEIARKYWENISDSDLAARRAATSARFKSYWANMSKEEFNIWKQNQAVGFNEYLENLGLIPNQNEMKFIELIRETGAKWSYQYNNLMVHPDFDKLFPRNDVLGVPRVNPYHKWDFIINLGTHSILVDVDGSIHDPSKTSYPVTYYNGKKFILSDYISFKDSQRPYQTDFCPAFIIRCYDDNMNDDTEVFYIQKDRTMKLKNFMSIIKSKVDSLRIASTDNEIAESSTTIGQQ